jgi:hypothetical protein
MENKKIIFFDEANNVYKSVDLDFFIYCCVQNNFFLQNKKIIKKFLFDKLKIKDEDVEIILNEFNKQYKKIEDFIRNEKNHEKYKDVLYNYLYYLHFNMLNRNQKLYILEKLNINQTEQQQIFKDFSF